MDDRIVEYCCEVCGAGATLRVQQLQAGVYHYLCHKHQDMAGIVTSDVPRTTTRDQLYRLHMMVCSYAFGIMKQRNESYSTGADALLNFRDDGELGILARMGDKRQRLKNWASWTDPRDWPGPDGQYPEGEEGALNAIADLVNYPILLLAYIAEKQPRLLKPLEEVLRIVRTDE